MIIGKMLMTSLVMLSFMSGCAGLKNDSRSTSNSNGSPPISSGNSPESGIEKVKPAPGTGNVQGKVFYNSKPVANIEVKLCEQFNQFLGGCSGKTFVARTDQNGEYVIANIEPKVYEGLLAKVFESDFYVFATSGLAGISSSKYEVTSGKTLFVPTTNLFKDDLKLSNPKAGAKINARNLELKWDSYPDAAYYKLSVFPEESSLNAPYVNERVDGNSFSVVKPLQNGTYRWQVEAYNSSDRKLAESSPDIKFTVVDGESK